MTDYLSKKVTMIAGAETERQKELLSVIKAITQERLGGEAAIDIEDQLKEKFCASTADHHSFPNYSLVVNSNLLLETTLSKIMGDKFKFNLVLSCASNSLNNEYYPRGIIYHSKNDNGYETNKLSILPSNSHNSNVYGFRKYKEEEIDKIRKIFTKEQAKKLTVEQQNKIASIIEHFENISNIQTKNFDDQITRINFEFWKNISQEKNPILYIEQEEVVNKAILKYHLNTQTLLGKIIFTEENEGIINVLTEKMESFLRQGSLPTYLFWYLTDKDNQRKKLIKKNNNLETEDGDFSISLSPESIEKAILEGKLMPNLLLVYLTIHLYYRLTCFGGFNQIHYLKSMRSVYEEYDPGTEKYLSDIYSFGFDLTKKTFTEFSGLDLYLYPEIKQVFYDNLENKKLLDLFEENSETIYEILNN